MFLVKYNGIFNLCALCTIITVATKAISAARSLKLATSTSVNTWMDVHQGRPAAVNSCPFVDMNF